MHPLFGLLGIAAILALAYAMSNNRRAINWRTVGVGFALQWLIALFVLKVPAGQALFTAITKGINHLLTYADAGAAFVFGPLAAQPVRMVELFGPGGDFIFAIKVTSAIVFIGLLVGVGYHIGLLQRVIGACAWVMYKLMGVSGSESLSNVASIFVGNIEAQLIIKPYLSSMTPSELLASMAGSLACISGSAMAIFIALGVPANYVLAASLMAAPGALVIAKLMYPETETSTTQGDVKLEVPVTSVNLIDAAAHGASDGFRIALQILAMLIGFIAAIHLVDGVIHLLGTGLVKVGINLTGLGVNLAELSLNGILGHLFSVVAFMLGVPWHEAGTVGALMGTKMVINEFVAYLQLLPMLEGGQLSAKSVAIVTFALCGFANFGSVAMQIGGIGEMAPSRKHDLAKLGVRALLCGTMASYISAAIAGILQGIPAAAA
ncbi:MAG: NupC/NupG family nucleoside CNT transporter [Cyanobacteria bacterium HKST-UBA04]|nr:NupC/NupG family nucleoside CNT transporter [Cyanobacteria bacterium HKST-UBA04]MCA9842161.1 NupC/NupG family nucleoside CNT transporter [Cyanobacteria bacterium HKST-UBA03]